MHTQLTEAGADALLNQPPRLFQIWYRRNGNERWRKLGRYGSYPEALDAISGSGDYRIVELRADADGDESTSEADRPADAQPRPSEGNASLTA